MLGRRACWSGAQVVIGHPCSDACDLIGLVDRAGNGRGDAMLVLGEAGVGKSRFTQAAVAAARSRGMAVLRGRAAPSPAPALYRPLAEALLSEFRTRGALPIDDLSGIRAAFNVLTPGLLGDDASPPADPSLILFGEAVLAVLRLLGEPAGVLLLLDDLHWVDRVRNTTRDRVNRFPGCGRQGVRRRKGDL